MLRMCSDLKLTQFNHPTFPLEDARLQQTPEFQILTLDRFCQGGCFLAGEDRFMILPTPSSSQNSPSLLTTFTINICSYLNLNFIIIDFPHYYCLLFALCFSKTFSLLFPKTPQPQNYVNRVFKRLDDNEGTLKITLFPTLIYFCFHLDLNSSMC